MSSTENNRRRNQIVAARSSEKVLRGPSPSTVDRTALWRILDDALEDARRSAVYAGQTDRAVRLARAIMAKDELWMRGEQMSLLID